MISDPVLHILARAVDAPEEGGTMRMDGPVVMIEAEDYEVIKKHLKHYMREREAGRAESDGSELDLRTVMDKWGMWSEVNSDIWKAR